MCFFKCVGSLCFLCRLGFSSPMEPSHQRAELSKVCTKTSSGLKPGENFEKNLENILEKHEISKKNVGKGLESVQATSKQENFEHLICLSASCLILITLENFISPSSFAFLRLPSPSFAIFPQPLQALQVPSSGGSSVGMSKWSLMP